jgi:ATP-binding cassette subfamily B (MDR/TAP) protein 1
MGIATSLEMKKMMGEDEAAGNGQDELNSPGGIAVETLLNIRTVAALTLERERFINYRDALAREQPHYVRDAFLAGFSSGVSVGIQQWVNALQFWFGGWIMFTYQGVFSFNDFLISMFSLLFSLFGLVSFCGRVAVIVRRCVRLWCLTLAVFSNIGRCLSRNFR